MRVSMVRDFSKDFMKDPTRSEKRINRMERRILKVLNRYEGLVVQAVRDAPRTLTHKAKQIPVTYDPAVLSQQVDILTDTDLKKPITDIVKEEIPEAYESGTAFADIALGGDPEYRKEHWKKVAALIERSDSYFKGYSNDVAKKIKGLLADAVIQEKTLEEILQEISKLFDPKDVNYSKLLTIVRTEVMVAVNTAIKDRYKDRRVKTIEWLTVMDHKNAMNPCPVCEDLDGKKFPIDDTPPCPIHPRCRCTLLPVVEIPKGDWYE